MTRGQFASPPHSLLCCDMDGRSFLPRLFTDKRSSFVLWVQWLRVVTWGCLLCTDHANPASWSLEPRDSLDIWSHASGLGKHKVP